MAKRKVAYRKKNQNRFSMFLVTLVVLMIMVVVAVGRIELLQRLDEVKAKEAELETQIQAEEKRTEEIEEYRKYTQTKKYVEEVAKDKLGLVYEGEILFKEEN
ncbi:MAG: septum formation initiator family protein [Lachnospiraceae bacterium]|nr:septum formation initiator family protein [Lachnospiraceae bacterium]